MTNPYEPQADPGMIQPGGQQPQPPQYGAPQYGPPATVPPHGADPAAPYGRDLQGQPYSDKTKLVAGLLGILLGSFGVGRFYLGYTRIGVAQIAVTWLTCGIGGLWPLIDGVMMLTGKVPDTQGRPLRDN
ncbi:TM2 domain-containing protein [Nocardia sp. NPDC059240]|uniref:TM2 domain-containing protein n=1 Tax=Nocardia sp. NPDC059240 TaxID=3346786 RepID=UPI00369620CE